MSSFTKSYFNRYYCIWIFVDFCMNINEVKTKYGQLIKDINFDRLDLELKNPNIFQILKISNTEIRHSNFLSWLLDPSQSHKIGDIF